MFRVARGAYGDSGSDSDGNSDETASLSTSLTTIAWLCYLASFWHTKQRAQANYAAKAKNLSQSIMVANSGIRQDHLSGIKSRTFFTKSNTKYTMSV